MASTSTTQASSGPGTQEHDKAQKEDNSNLKIDVEKQSGAVSFEPDTEPPFSIFSDTKKKLIVLTISFIGLLSPLSANIYFPAITAIAKDLDVSNSDINLTVTTYLVSIILTQHQAIIH